jgi:tRNA threonylcarbamoyladenosine biosynthesis protein TsaB
MLLLVTDTSGKRGSVALARADSKAHGVDLIDQVPLAGGTFSAQLVPQIATLLASHGLSKNDIDAFVVVSGPGSFTGLRVGLAAIKALAEILKKPIVPVSLLEVVALASGTRGNVMAALDAGRGEIYAGEYLVADSAQFVSERLLTKDEFLAAAQNVVVATPDEVLAKTIRDSGIRLVQVPSPDPLLMARAGLHRLEAGLNLSPEQLEANYIRRSDAEIFAKDAS